MATEPRYTIQRQSLIPDGRGRLQVSSSPDSFGAAIGRATQGLGRAAQGATDAVAAVQAFDDKATVEEKINQYSAYLRERTYDPETGYVTQEGKNAVEGRAAYETDVEAGKARFGEGLTPAQQRLYERAAGARSRQALDTGIRHAAAQRKKWFDDASTARLDTFANDALAMSDEPEKLKVHIAAGLQEIDQRAQARGWAREQRDAAKAEYRSGIHKNVILKHAVTDPLKAQEWLDKNRDHMTQEHQFELDKALDEPVLTARAQVEAERIAQSPDTPQPAKAQARGRIDGITTSDPSVDIDRVKPEAKTAFGRLQNALGTRLVVKDGFREKQGTGAEKSQHLHGGALDIDIRNMTKQERLELIDAAFDAGFTAVGVGSTTLHVDMGRPRAWGYATAAGGAPVPEYARALVERRLGRLRGGARKHEGRVPPKVTTGAVDSAAAMLRKFEGFRSDTYWDVNHHRLGYGSDTRTDAGGRVHKVRKGDIVTQEDAERDLARRLAGANRKLHKRFGPDIWLGLTPEARGALLSVTYNYGTLPKSVARAVRTGDVDAVASAVSALADNPGRRREEAAVIRGGRLPKGVKVSGQFTFVGPRHVADAVSGIADPRLRAKTAAALASMYRTQDAAQRRADRQNKLQAERFIIQNPGVDPTKLPLSVQQGLGIDGMNTVWAYNDKVRAQGEVVTDERTFAELQRLQADDPYAFADNVDLFDYLDKLSTQDRRALQKLQVEALKDRRAGTQEALVKSKSVATAMSIADDRLEAAGVKKTGKAKDEESMQREARFQKALIERMREFQTQEKRIPTDFEVSDMVDQLLLPIIIKEPGMLWGTNDVEGFVFEAPFRADNATVDINVSYESIPVDVRLAIRTELAKELGRDPTEDEVKADYVEFVLTGK